MCRKYGVVAVYLHGSRAKGYAAPDSDTDVAVVVKDKKGMSLNSEIALIQEFEKVLRVENPDVKIVDFRGDKVFLFNVINGKALYAGEEREKSKFEFEVTRDYYDQKRIRDIYSYFLIKQAKNGNIGHRPANIAQAFG